MRTVTIQDPTAGTAYPPKRSATIALACIALLVFTALLAGSYLWVCNRVQQHTQIDSALRAALAYPWFATFIVGFIAIIGGTRYRLAHLRGLYTVDLALQTANQRLNNVIRGAGLATWLYTPEKFTYDAEWMRLFGDENPQSGEMTIARLMEAIHPDDRALIYAAVTNQKVGNTPTFDLRLRHSSDEWRWHRIIGYVEQCDAEGNCLSAPGFTLEVSAQKDLEQSEAALKTLSADLSMANERMSKLMEDAGIHTWDFTTANGGVFNVDAQWQRNMSWPNPEHTHALSFKELMDLMHPDDRHVQGILLQNLTEGQYLTFELRMRNSKDEYVWHRSITRIVTVDAQGKGTHYAGMGYDITPQKLLEQSEALLEIQVAQRTAELEESRNQAQAASQAKSDFLANMSHEIRTPMNGIIGLSYLALQCQDIDPQLRNYIIKIDDSAKALLRIINDILDFSKINAGKLDIEYLPFDLTETLEHLIQPLIPSITAKGLEILLDFSRDTPTQLVGDAIRLRQVIINLVNNAIKFTASGSILIRIECVDRSDTQATLRFTVADTGMGIAPKYLEHLFEAFSQADSSVTRRYGGTGLGLAISKRIVGLMGGEISVESTVGQGCTFSFTAKFGIAEVLINNTGMHCLDQKRVLIVDDNELSRRILESYTRNFGALVDCVADGETALAFFTEKLEQGVPYHAVVLDWKMPGMNGLELAASIRGIAKGNTPPTIMVTAYDRELVNNDTKQAGIDEVLTKPVTPSALHDALLKATVDKDKMFTTGTAPNSLPDASGTYSTALSTSPSAPSRFGATQAPHAPDAPGAPDAPVQPTRPPLLGKRVLLAEDNEINQLIGVELLSSYGITVTVANNGLEAIQLALATPFDVILMDIQMPEMDGIEATKILREQHHELDAVPIIAMTAHAMAGDYEKSLTAGMQGHITKPIDPEKLFATLQQWMHKTSGGTTEAYYAGH